MRRPIIQAPDQRLRLVAQAVPAHGEAFNYDYEEVVDDLQDTFKETTNCIGLAASQLDHPVYGVIRPVKRIIIVDITAGRTETYVMVNPVIVKASDDLQQVRDGCMSVGQGRRFANTKRPKRLVVEWVDPASWTAKKQKFSGLLAAVIHHEIDHLDGILYTDRIAAAIAKGEAK